MTIKTGTITATHGHVVFAPSCNGGNAEMTIETAGIETKGNSRALLAPNVGEGGKLDMAVDKLVAQDTSTIDVAVGGAGTSNLAIGHVETTDINFLPM